MTTIIVAVFCIVYLGMILGGLPFLQLDRTGIALLCTIALIGVEADQAHCRSALRALQRAGA